MRSVYLMKTNHDLYKVGIAKDVDKRLKGLQTSNGNKILLVTHARCGNALSLEKQVHTILEKHRQSGGREWFELTPEQALKICIYIHQNAENYDSEDDIRMLLDEYAVHHESIVNAKKGLEQLSEQVGSDIQKSIARLRRYKPLPKITVMPKEHVKTNEDKKLFNQALEFVKTENKASTSLLQRKFKIGYGRAARIIEKLEEQGIVGPADGSRPREIISY